MIKAAIKESLERTLSMTCQNGLLGIVCASDCQVMIERPRNPEHGDYACGVSFRLAGKAKLSPLRIAQTLAEAMQEDIAKLATVKVSAPGYLNFRVQKDALQETLKTIHQGGDGYGRREIGIGKKVLIEYVSAKSTAPKHLSRAREAVFGACLATLMRFCGFNVEEESPANPERDAAYYKRKFERGYDLLINIWGADRHSQVAGLKALCSELGQSPEQLEVILTQVVKISQENLIDEVASDSLRYFLLESDPENAIRIDLELAKKTSRENPAFYIQYAHARSCALLRRALEPTLNHETMQEEPALIGADQWSQWKIAFAQSKEVFSDAFDCESELYQHQKKLAMQLELFSDEVEDAFVYRQPGRLARYAYELANDLQKYYDHCQLVCDDLVLMKARLGLIDASRQVLANALHIIGVRALDRM